MEDDFDEFGNFIGNEYSESEAEVENDEVEEESTIQYITPQSTTQSINEPLVKRTTDNKVKTIEPTNWIFLSNILKNIPSLIYNICIVGNSGHGKTSLCKWLSANIGDHPTPRGVSQQSSFYSILVSDANNKSHALNLADTPGHPDFKSELISSLELCDGICLVVDVVEGLLPTKSDLPNETVGLIVLNKIDRLILELRLSPLAAAERIKLVWNQCKARFPSSSIVFASAKYEFSFSIQSVNELYKDYQGVVTIPVNDSDVDLNGFANYVLQPLFKLFSCALIGESTSEALYQSTGIKLNRTQWQCGFETRVRVILEQYFENTDRVLADELIRCGSNKKELSPSAFIKYVELSGHVFAFCTGPIEGNIYIPNGQSITQIDAIGEHAWGLIPKLSPLPPNRLHPSYPQPIFYVAIEPFPDTTRNSEELRSSLEELRSFNPELKFVQAVSGEFSIFGYGELYFDTLLRRLKCSIPFKLRVSQPLPLFQETVVRESSIALPTKSNSGEFVVVMIAKPRVESESDKQTTDILCIYGSCELKCLSSIDIDSNTKSYLIDGFRWCCQRGPLIEEKLTNVTFIISELEMSSTAKATVQVAALMERACHAALLLASPKLTEPLVEVYTVGKALIGKALYREMEKRGGLICTDTPIYLTNLYYTSGIVPALDHLGMEIDVLMQLESRDTGRIVSFFNGSYQIVSGDPLDSSLPIVRLKTAPDNARARDYMLKLRKRKGLSRTPELENYIDNDIKDLLF